MAKKKDNREIEIDEIFLDHENPAGFHRENLEGMIEHPIKKEIFWSLGGVLTLLLVLFGLRIGFLQAVKGESFYERSEKNYLKVVSQNNERGTIYDRNGNSLAYNDFIDGKTVRKYPPAGFLHVLGYVDSPSGSAEGAFRGVSGLEAAYDALLAGEPDKTIEEVDAKGAIVSAGILQKGQPGKSILTSLDKNLQAELADAVASSASALNFEGGAGIILDIKTGEILALASVPSFDPNLLSSGGDPKKIEELLKDERKPFLNRAISGLYPPGSIVKPALAAGALTEGIIAPDKKILSTGSISVPNPYDAAHPNIFMDWKPLGWLDMRLALAESSDVYFYEVGGGYQGQKGLGPWNIKKYLSMFGFADKTGVDLPGEQAGHLPDPTEKQGGRDWSIGDTYHISIGQGDVTVTPIQMAVYAAAIASNGTLLYPHLAKEIVDENKNPVEELSYPAKTTLSLAPDVFAVIKEGMRSSAEFGTAALLANMPIEVAAKTGTAETGQKSRVNSWSIGFFPYNSPRLAFAFLMERGPRTNTVSGATLAASRVIQWIGDTGFLSKLDSGMLH